MDDTSAVFTALLQAFVALILFAPATAFIVLGVVTGLRLSPFARTMGVSATLRWGKLYAVKLYNIIIRRRRFSGIFFSSLSITTSYLFLLVGEE